MNILKVKNFSSIPNLIHGFSTRDFGSMRPDDPQSQKALKNFLSALSIPLDRTIRMHQIHSNTVTWVSKKNINKTIEKTDGLVTKEKNIFLIVIVGDCAPLLFFDKKREYSGVAHAGWRGVLNNISEKIIQQMIKAGSNPEDIMVGIGPCIRSCCYQVDQNRIEEFKKRFQQEDYIQPENRLDLPMLITQQLIKAGIPLKNIEDTKICTSDNIGRFYSYRKEGEKFGEFVGIIGMTTKT